MKYAATVPVSFRTFFRRRYAFLKTNSEHRNSSDKQALNFVLYFHFVYPFSVGSSTNICVPPLFGPSFIYPSMNFLRIPASS